MFLDYKRQKNQHTHSHTFSLYENFSNCSQRALEERRWFGRTYASVLSSVIQEVDVMLELHILRQTL